MPLFPFRSSSVKPKSSSTINSSSSTSTSTGGLFSKNRHPSHSDGQQGPPASVSDHRRQQHRRPRRRQPSPDDDDLWSLEPGSAVTEDDGSSRTHDDVSRPPPSRRGRTPSRRRTSHRSSLSPSLHQGSSHDSHRDPRPNSPDRYRPRPSSELIHLQSPPPTSAVSTYLLPPNSNLHDRRRSSYAPPPLPVVSAPSIAYQYLIDRANQPTDPSKSMTTTRQITTARHRSPPSSSATGSPRNRSAVPVHSRHVPRRSSVRSTTTANSSSDGIDGVNRSSNSSKRPQGMFSTYKAVKELSKHADKAKQWIEWLDNVNDAPDEIRLLSSKVKIAKDTVSQIQISLEARPDLVEDESGQNLKMQIEEVIDGTSETLKKMSRLLSGFTAAAQQEGTALGRLEGFWQSFDYKNDGEAQIRATDHELQIQLTELSMLMSNIYARALRSPKMTEANLNSATPSFPATKSTEGRRDMDSPTRQQLEKPAKTREGKASRGSRGPRPDYKDASASSANRAPDTPPISPPGTSKNPERDRTRRDWASTPESHDTDNGNDPREPRSNASSRLQHKRPLTSSGLISTGQYQSTALGTDSSTSSTTTNPPQPPRISIDLDLDHDEESEEEYDENYDGEYDYNHDNDRNRSPADLLFDAAWDGNLEAIAATLEHVSPNACDHQNLTALHLAVERDHMAAAMLLLDRGADVHARAGGGCMPLHLAARYASADTVEMLLDRAGADPNARSSDGRTALHYAARSAVDGDDERREVIRTLRDWGVDPTLANRRGETARDVAQKRNHWDAAATLRRAEKKRDETTGHCAVDHMPQDKPSNWLQRYKVSER